MKKFAIILLVLLAAIGGGFYYVHANLDSIVRAAIEKYGSQATQTAVRVSSVKLSLSTGEGTLGHLTVANPKDFSSSNALSMDVISVKVDTNSIRGNGPIVIREIVLASPQVLFEATATGDSNLQALQRNIGGSGKADKTADKSAPGRKVIINDLIVRDGQISISHPLLQGKAMTAALPLIHLTNIGKGGGGVTPAVVADLVIRSITTNAVQIASIDLTKTLGSLKSTVTGAPQTILNHLNGVIGK